MITGKTLVEWGFKPGAHFKQFIYVANMYKGMGFKEDAIREALTAIVPKEMSLQDAAKVPLHMNIIAETDAEADNLQAVEKAMMDIIRTPTVKKATVLPDACPTGGMPVGTVVATENAIHPGFHSADICCSVACTVMENADPSEVFETAFRLCHFGPGGRQNPKDLVRSYLRGWEDNPFLKDLTQDGKHHFMTCGDGNHFVFVGTQRSTGKTAIVTHYGSRKPGAKLYKKGLQVAEKYRAKLTPKTDKKYAWIPFDTQDGQDYWYALQMIRLWTKGNHFELHSRIMDKMKNIQIVDQFWNEHNFVFQRDGLFYHGKGATPAWKDFAQDSSGLTLIPLNMTQPILVTEGLDNPKALGFAPHGAGRNFSRTQHIKSLGQCNYKDVLKRETEGIEVRFKSGEPDLSELPSAYKNAETICSQIEHFELADVADFIDPYGTIMAGRFNRVYGKRRK